MAFNKIYIIRQDFYDYFGGHKVRTYQASTPIEAINIYHKESAHDFNYSDAFQTTYFPSVVYLYTPDVQRPHAREEWEWADIKYEYARSVNTLSEEEIALLFDYYLNSDDIDDVIDDDDFYVLDDDDLIFDDDDLIFN